MSTWKLPLAVVVEIIYMVLSRVVLPDFATGIERELIKTVLRIASALVYWFLFRELIVGHQYRSGSVNHPAVLSALALVLLVPVVVADHPLPDLTTKTVFAATSIFVAIREEFFYRGIIQNVIGQRFGLVAAIVASNVLFAVYHYGAQPLSLARLVDLFALGSICGLIYFKTGSIWVVVGLHAAIDVIWAFTPIVDRPLPYVFASVIDSAALILCVAWVWLPRLQARPAKGPN